MNFIYITCSSKEEALNVGKALLQEKLVACINILPGMTSAYWWKGQIETAEEVVLIAKSRRSQLDRLVEVVKKTHSYEIPCVVSLPIEGGNPDFLDWILSS
jgi:periplasmic divalent cation tolerance protein